MQAQTLVVNFHKCTSNEKTLLDRYRSKFDKGTRSIKVTPPITVAPLHGTLEVTANFLDISKASGNLPSFLKSFLNSRFQRVVVNDQCFSWSPVLAGVHWGSILGRLLFLI